jgi:hydrogenase maturation protease
MGDDSVGIHVVRILKDRFQQRTDLEFKELSVGGLRLVEELLGYEKAFIVDSTSGRRTVGRIREFSPDQFKETLYASSPHVTNFATALELYTRLENGAIPDTIRVFTIDIESEFTFSETMSPPVQRAASELIELIANELNQIHN